MRKLEKRAFICLILAAVLFLGLIVFSYRFVRYGGQWATFYGNQGLYSEGMLATGEIKDRHGDLLMYTEDGSVYYSDDYYVRLGTLHAVGDTKGNIETSALSTYRDRLIGYNLITGVYRLIGGEGTLDLTIDSQACSTAYQWLSYYSAGAVGVYNYKTGEILCLVSTPSFDPYEDPEIEGGDEGGIFINRFFSATFTPGSIFKTVTAAAAIKELDWENFVYTCDGQREVGGEYVTCMEAHGEQGLREALANSCNCAFSVLTEQLGAKTMTEYVDKFGLTTSYNMSGIRNAKGHFNFPEDVDIDMDWAGVGQFEDELNPCSMMIYMGAIANGGKAAVPRMISSNVVMEKIPIVNGDVELLDSNTAIELRDMMENNVESVYGSWNFPDLSIGAKTGTGEVEDKESNATFAGFLNDPNHPYAFVVVVEDAGGGQAVAAPIANAVLQVLVANN